MLSASRGISYDLDLILFTCLALTLVAMGLLHPVVPYDTVAYHLPFGAKLAHIDKAEDFFLYDKHHLNAYEYRFLGFPLFPYYIQGYLFRIFRSWRVLPLVSSISLILLCMYVKKLFNISRSLFLLLCVTVPMIAIHSQSSYVDLFCGSLVASLAFITIKYLEFQPSFKERLHLGITFVIISFLCGQTKFFTLPFVYPLALICAWASMSRCHDRKQGSLLAIIFFTAGVAACLKLFSNWHQFNNPFYPIGTTLFDGPEPAWSSWSASPGYMTFLGPLVRPIYFFCSVTELDLLIRGIKPLYTVIDSAQGDTVYTAGFGFMNVIAFVLWQIYYFKYAGYRDARVVNSIKIFALMLTINSVLPQCFVLRYWMYIPILACFLALVQLSTCNNLRTKVVFIVSAVCVFMVMNAYTNYYYQLFQRNIRPTYVFPAEAIQKANPSYICTSERVEYPFGFSTVLNKGNWKTNPPACNEINDDCKCFVDIIRTEYLFNCTGCGKIE